MWLLKLFTGFQSVRHELTIVSCSRLTKWTRKWRTTKKEKKKTVDRETLTGRPTSQPDRHAMGVPTTATTVVVTHRLRYLFSLIDLSIQFFFRPSEMWYRKRKKTRTIARQTASSNVGSYRRVELGVMCARTEPMVILFDPQFSIEINSIITDETFWLQMAISQWKDEWKMVATFERWAKVTTFKWS